MPKVYYGKEKLCAFPYFGGKFSHLDWLLPLLPPSYHYCEPFAGSGVVILNRSPSQIETYNDLDGEIVNFFKVLRSQKEELIEQISLTPFSRKEFTQACDVDNTLSELERARRLYLRAKQVRIGLVQKATESSWGCCVGRIPIQSKTVEFSQSIKKLHAIAERFKLIQIENRPAIKVIQFYDTEGTLFYVDPPYIHTTRPGGKAYKSEMSDVEHIKLAKVLNNIKGKAAVSGYECELMDKLYPFPKWKKHFNKFKKLSSSDTNREAREVLWCNYSDIKVM